MVMLSGCQYEVFNQVNHCVLFTMLSDIKGCIFLTLWGIFCYCGTSTREYSQGTPRSPFPFLRLKVLTGLVPFTYSSCWVIQLAVFRTASVLDVTGSSGMTSFLCGDRALGSRVWELGLRSEVACCSSSKLPSFLTRSTYTYFSH